jgi:hypothetical protein
MWIGAGGDLGRIAGAARADASAVSADLRCPAGMDGGRWPKAIARTSNTVIVAFGVPVLGQGPPTARRLRVLVLRPLQ